MSSTQKKLEKLSLTHTLGIHFPSKHGDEDREGPHKGRVIMLILGIIVSLGVLVYRVFPNKLPKKIAALVTPVEVQNAQMLQLYRASDKTAIAGMQMVIERFPLVAPLHSNLAVMQASETATEAEATFEKALELDPNNTTILANFGAFYGMQNDYTKAESYLKQALKIDPNHVQTLLTLAIHSEKQQLNKLALEFYDQYLQRAPANDRLRAIVSDRARQLHSRHQHEIKSLGSGHATE